MPAAPATFQVPDLYLHWGLSHHRCKSHVWKSKCGVHVYGQHGYGVPFRRARVMLVYLATLVRDGNWRYLTGSLDEMADWFGISWPMEDIEAQLYSVVQTRFRCGDVCVCKPARCRELQSVASGIHYCAETRKFRLVMSEDFVRSMALGPECPAEPVRRLVQRDQLAALDLLVWACTRVHHGNVEPVNAFASDGPFAWIKSAERRFRKRKELARIHAEVVKAWPEFPFHLEADDRIVYDPARAHAVVEQSVRQTASEMTPVEPSVGPAFPAPVEMPIEESATESVVSASRTPNTRRTRRAVPVKRSRPTRPRSRPGPRVAMPAPVEFKRRMPSLIRKPGRLPDLPDIPDIPDLPPLPELPGLPLVRALERDPPDSS